MWKSLTSFIILVVMLTLMTTLQACTKYHDSGDNGSMGKSGRYDQNIGPYGGPFSGKGPGGMGVK